MAKRSVPVIDMEDTNVAAKIVKAFEEWGCFRLVNHGVAADIMAEMMAVARDLTDLPMEMKMRTADPRCLLGSYTKPADGWPYYEGLNLHDVALPGTIDRFCSQIDASPHHKEVLDKYTSSLHDLAQFIGGKMMEGLGMEGDLFKNYACQLKINKYYHEPKTVGFTTGLIHTDPGFITLLQDDEIVNGLEAMDKTTAEFVPLDHIPGSLVINLGDIAEVWSNGRFYIPNHRVQCHGPAVRRSIGYFALAPRDEKVETPPEMVDSDHPRRYVPFDFQEYILVRQSAGLASGQGLHHFLA